MPAWFPYEEVMLDELASINKQVDKISHENMVIDTIYLNFAKAFNTVSLQRLIIKLHGYDVHGNALQ